VILNDLTLTLARGERLALIVPNGSGKTSILRALLGDPAVQRSGSWRLPPNLIERTGHLDQYYHLLNADETVWETIWHYLGAALFVHHASLEMR
jgi:ATPase subunit of ABC transporter with duplicated ATPase domains